MIHATTWMNLRCTMLNERSQAQKATYYMIPFIWQFLKIKAIGTIKKSVLMRL